VKNIVILFPVPNLRKIVVLFFKGKKMKKVEKFFQISFVVLELAFGGLACFHQFFRGDERMSLIFFSGFILTSLLEFIFECVVYDAVRKILFIRQNFI
jgi:hypothetical protein